MDSSYRERREARAERLRGWADKREDRAADAFERATELGRQIPFGQPILVGHHSERGHRADINRIDSAMGEAVESDAMARRMRERADSIEAQARRSIYSDDPDALGALRAKLSRLEEQRDAMKARNASYRREHRAELRGMSAYERSQAVPHPGWEVSNLGGVITSTRKRIESLAAPESSRLITARFAGECRACGSPVAAGDQVHYFARSKQVACVDCEAVPMRSI